MKTTSIVTQAIILPLLLLASCATEAGNNGPSYTKMDAHGNFLDESATSWSCVMDSNSGLVWEVADDSLLSSTAEYDWEESGALVTHVNSHSLCGITDWRLPTSDELLSIVDSSREEIKINTAYFPDTQGGFYWTSTESSEHGNGAWTVLFILGKEFVGNKQIRYHARTVGTLGQDTVANR
jgi:hypothetical protein